MSIVEVKNSDVPGGFRQTTTYSDGTSTDITKVGNDVTIDDHDAKGGTRSYEGVTGTFGTLSGAGRLREK